MISFPRIAALGCLTALSLWSAAAQGVKKPDAARLATLPPPAGRPVDFKKEIQPIFQNHCLSCHGPKRQEADFRLDSPAALQGGLLGPAIIPGKSDQSMLIHFVAGLDPDTIMPQKGERLSPEQIGLLRAWIDQGAVWPDEGQTSGKKNRRDHWAFQKPKKPAIPSPHTLKKKTWLKNPVDHFVLKSLETEKLTPAPEADRVTLIRRLSFDLLGLPPTPSEIEFFVKDRSPDAYAKLVDRLLASPHYGERWGRHWLDIVHFGETHGYDKDKPRQNAWPYRDYVIRAFNEDKPYSRFVQEQLAGDILHPQSTDGIVATGFIAAGPWDFVGHVELPESKTDGLIARYNDRDDMLMTAMSTFQSLTVHCARCHNHKFDPIPQEDYYRLQAVFAGVDRADRAYDPDPSVQLQRFQGQQERRELQQTLRSIEQKWLAQAPPKTAELKTRLAVLEQQLESLRSARRKNESPSNGYHSQIEPQPQKTKWVQADLGTNRSITEIQLISARPTDFADTPGFGFPVRFYVEVLPDGPNQTWQRVADHSSADYPNPGLKAVSFPIQGLHARYIRITATHLAARSNDYIFALAELLVKADLQWADLVQVTAFDSIESGRWSKRFLGDGFSSRAPVLEKINAEIEAKSTKQTALAAELEAQIATVLDRQTLEQKKRAEARLSELDQALSRLPASQKVYAGVNAFTPEGNFKPAQRPRLVHVLKRGDVKSPGPEAMPGALSCLPDLPGTFSLENPLDEGERRVALAKWITDTNNLLTRRSIVNRVWQYHFGKGIVDTPNDFGHMGSLPSHPELLDWLAYWFMDHGESFKELHRLILNSATYRQSTQENPAYALKDADNRFLWRMNRQRLDAEAVRDSMLAISGSLDPKMGGISVRQFYFRDDHSPEYDYARFDVTTAGAYRRSVYRFIVRSVPDPWMDSLDCADPSILTPKRNSTLTALQALSLLNNPFVLHQSEQLARRLEKQAPDLPGRIRLLYQLALGRPPTSVEQRRLEGYAIQHGLVNACRLIFNSNEFVFID